MRARRRRRRRRRRALGLLVLLALLAIPALLGAWAWRVLHSPYRGYPESERRVVIEPGTSARAILEQLEDQGILADATLARLYLVYRLGNPALKAGEYRFEKELTTPQVLARLLRGEVVSHRLTLVEGLTLAETAAAIAEAGFGRREALIEAMGATELVADLDPEATDLEGYLFPDTYSFARGTSEAAIVKTMVTAFRERFERHVRPLIEDPAAWPPRRLVTLASIVEKEAGLDPERPLVAAVFANRLDRGIGLYADPTVIYALKLEGRWDGNLRRGDLELDSPYNTYRYPGLPPSPICSPGLASLLAAAEPADVPYLYFVSRNDGSHVFAETLAEHNRNVERWQKRYWRERWAQERR